MITRGREKLLTPPQTNFREPSAWPQELAEPPAQAQRQLCAVPGAGGIQTALKPTLEVGRCSRFQQAA